MQKKVQAMLLSKSDLNANELSLTIDQENLTWLSEVNNLELCVGNPLKFNSSVKIPILLSKIFVNTQISC
jgi:hypothetical protein